MAKDLDLFRAAMADVTPLKGRRRPKASSTITRAKSAAPAKAMHKSATSPAPPARRTPPAPVDEAAFDRDIDRALSRGRRSPEAKLDLHGMTLAAAERAVSRFLEEAAALEFKVVLIVTGKGLRQEGDRVFGGRIRAEFRSWLQRADNRARVRGVKSAHARHGGGGAFYVLLRRPRRPHLRAG